MKAGSKSKDIETPVGSYHSTLKYVCANSDTKSPLRKVILDNFIWAVGPDFHRPEEADWEVLGEFLL